MASLPKPRKRARRRGPERMGLPLDIYEGQRLTLHDDHGVVSRRAGAAELAAVHALDP
jgi:hypothetical protein